MATSRIRLVKKANRALDAAKKYLSPERYAFYEYIVTHPNSTGKDLRANAPHYASRPLMDMQEVGLVTCTKVEDHRDIRGRLYKRPCLSATNLVLEGYPSWSKRPQGRSRKTGKQGIRRLMQQMRILQTEVIELRRDLLKARTQLAKERAE